MLFRKDASAQGMVEYGLIMMLVALIVILLLVVMGPAVGNLYSNIVANF